jgi:uncharacterized protein DUF3592
MFGLGSSLFTLFFLIVLGVVVWQVVRAVMRSQEIDELRRSGRRIAATVTNILHERVQSSPATPPNPATNMPARAARYRDDWYVEAGWTDPQTSQSYAFKSERLDREEAMRYRAGDPITVLVDPGDPGRYYVEIAG